MAVRRTGDKYSNSSFRVPLRDHYSLETDHICKLPRKNLFSFNIKGKRVDASKKGNYQAVSYFYKIALVREPRFFVVLKSAT